jgi:type IV pilus assembly protein PilP
MFETLLAMLISVAAQTPLAAYAPAAPAAPARTAEHPAAAAGYSYNPEGRRDPFVSLVGRGSDGKDGGLRSAGVAGLLIDELTVKGVIRGSSGYLAMVQSPGTMTYIVRNGDRLGDGSVKEIDKAGVVFAQDVAGPLGVVTQRAVPKRVRAGSGPG